MSAASVGVRNAYSVPRWTWLLTLVPLPLLCFVAVELEIAPVVAIAMLAAGGTVLGRHGRLDIAGSLLAGFFAVAAFHVLIGFLIAGQTSRLIWIGTRAEQVYAQAFLLIAAGLFTSIIGYVVATSAAHRRLQAWCRRIDLREERVIAIARVLIIPGVILVAYVYARIGLIPLLADSPGRARYFNYQLSSDYLMDEWLVSRALDLLTFSLPLVIGSALWRQKWIDIGLAILGTAALLVPLRRANLICVVVVVLLMQALKVGRLQLKYVAVILALVAAYAVSQFLFVKIIGLADLDADAAIAVTGSALPEVRDLAWTLDLMDGQSLNGTTFLQALVPIPSLISDFSQTHSLRAVTSRLIGLDADRQTGGLRLTLAGEAYLNFGYSGPVIIGLLFGIACGKVENLMRVLAERRVMWARWLGALVFVWLCFWVYLGGTQAAATIKIGGLLLLLSLHCSRAPGPNSARHDLPPCAVRI